VQSVEFGPDGRLVLTIAHAVTIWDAASGHALHTLRGHTDQINTAVFAPDGRRIVTASRDGTARIWDTRTGRALRILRPGIPLPG
jgi:WD40 repeat protein